MPIEDMVQINEGLGKVTIVTRGNSKIVVDDTNKSMILQDINGNRIEMGPLGITIVSVKDITFDAAGGIVMGATGNIATNSRADVSQSGLNITNQAQMAFVAKGNASAELSAAGQTVVKGSLVMIN